MNADKAENILVIFCDQLRIDLLGCYGGKQVRTPNIDSLAADSLIFDNAYTPTAICSPARASLMAGLYPHGHRMFNNSTPRYSYCHHLPPEVTMIQDWADDATEYQTGYFGKWHIGPAEDLFNSRFHKTQPRPYDGGQSYLGTSHWHPNLKLGELVEEKGNQKIAPGQVSGTVRLPMEKFPDVAAMQYCMDFINDRDGDRPFLAFCAFPGPHSPWLVPDEFGIRYDPDEISLWPNRNDPMQYKPLNQLKLHKLARINEGHIDATERDANLRQKLAACFSYMELIDLCVGELVADLKKRGLYENTAIFFTADHGDMAGGHGFPSKGSYMYDEIYRIPLLYKPAGGGMRARISQPVHLMDVTTTCVDIMAGGEREEMNGQQLHGCSLNRFKNANADWPRTAHYAEYHGDWYGHYSARMITDGRWKLVWNFSDLCELYDLDADPGELHNRFYEPEYRDMRKHCFSLLASEAEKLNDGQAMQFLKQNEAIDEFEDSVMNEFFEVNILLRDPHQT